MEKTSSYMRTLNYNMEHYSESAVKAADDYVQLVHGNDASYEVSRKAVEDALPDDKKICLDLLEINSINKEHVLSAYLFGMQHAISKKMTQEDINPVRTSEYTKTKDFAFTFDFGDNDFGGYLEKAAENFCNEYNSLLHNINIYSKHETPGTYSMTDSYKKDILYMEDKDNIKDMLMSLFVGAYMSNSADRAYCFDKPKFSHTKHMEDANHYVDYLFGHFDEDFCIGTWKEVKKNGEEKYRGMQDANTPRELTKYWLNGEVLIVRMVNGLLVSEVR